MVSTFVAFILLTTYQVPYPLAFVGALLFAALLGMAIERVLMRWVQNATVLTQIMLTLGLFLVLNGAMSTRFFEALPFPQPIGGTPFDFGGVRVSADSLLIFGLAATIMLALYAFFRFTLLGIALRATAQNLPVARLMGVRVGRVYATTWAFAAVLGAVAGMLIAPTTALYPSFMGEVAIKGFAGAILGGPRQPARRRHRRPAARRIREPDRRLSVDRVEGRFCLQLDPARARAATRGHHGRAGPEAHLSARVPWFAAVIRARGSGAAPRHHRQFPAQRHGPDGRLCVGGHRTQPAGRHRRPDLARTRRLHADRGLHDSHPDREGRPAAADRRACGRPRHGPGWRPARATGAAPARPLSGVGHPQLRRRDPADRAQVGSRDRWRDWPLAHDVPV